MQANPEHSFFFVFFKSAELLLFCSNLTFCMFPEKRSAVEEMALFTFLRRSFLVSGQPTSFLARR